MELHIIREQLVDQLADSEDWVKLMNDTNPGHYGIEDWSITIDPECFYVDIPNGKFTFRNALLIAELTLGASRREDSFPGHLRTIANGQGTFKFKDKDHVEIENTEIQADLDIFQHQD